MYNNEGRFERERGVKINKRALGLGALTLMVCAIMLYYLFALGSNDLDFAHLYYLLIILAALWWERGSWLLTAFLSIFVLASRIISHIETPIMVDLGIVLFLVIGIVIAKLARARRQTEEALRVSHQQVASILENMLDAVIVVNPDGTIRTVNWATVNLLGYAKEELVGQPSGSFFDEEDFFSAKLVREGAVWNVELTLLAKSGEQIPVVLNGSVIRKKDGHVSSVVSVVRDIREHKQTERQLRKLNELYKRMIPLAAHELRTPLTSIQGYASLLRDGEIGSVSPKQEETLDTITRNSQQLSSLIDTFLDLEKLETGKHYLGRSHFLLEELLSEVKKTFGRFRVSCG